MVPARSRRPARLEQDYAALEVVVCDEASGDGTASSRAEQPDPRIRRQRHPVQIGGNAGFDACPERARGSLSCPGSSGHVAVSVRDWTRAVIDAEEDEEGGGCLVCGWHRRCVCCRRRSLRRRSLGALARRRGRCTVQARRPGRIGAEPVRPITGRGPAQPDQARVPPRATGPRYGAPARTPEPGSPDPDLALPDGSTFRHREAGPPIDEGASISHAEHAVLRLGSERHLPSQ